ncbi:MAG TPA: Gfo/Idh/MocA family oxidoreductase, partial [Amycolatopsis sp.]|nr:Gfo/Idh/MocA family oxidoreductase [Amycolatopsis sp.]
MTPQLRIGILGAARIAPAALINPAKKNGEVIVAAVAARDTSRAQAFASRHGIPKVHAGYDDLVGDPDLGAIYNPLPNGLHGRWTRAALAAGKHVLCEKPIAMSLAEAKQMLAAAQAAKVVHMTAFTYRFVPGMRYITHLI